MYSTEYENEISLYREDIDLIDRDLLALLEKRMDKVNAIGLLKKRYKVQVLDKNREAFIIESRVSMLKNKEYANAIKDIFTKIMEVSRNIQE